MDNRISATGLKNIDADTIEAHEIKVTDQTIIDETGLQVYHPYNILLPFTFSGYWNVHDQIEGIKIEDNFQNLQLEIIEATLGITKANLTSLAAAVAAGTPIAAAVGSLFGANALQGLALKQDKIHTFNAPLDYDDSDPENRSLSLKYDMSLALDASGNLKVNSITWDKISNPPSTFPPSTHTHIITDISGLQLALDGKAPSTHTHTIDNITNLQSILDGKSNTGHTHEISNINGLQLALDSKATTTTVNSIVSSQWTTSITAGQGDILNLYYNKGQVAIGTNQFPRKYF